MKHHRIPGFGLVAITILAAAIPAMAADVRVNIAVPGVVVQPPVVVQPVVVNPPKSGPKNKGQAVSAAAHAKHGGPKKQK